MLGLLLVGAGAVVEELYCPPLRRLEKAGVIRVAGVVDPDTFRAKRISDRFKNATAFSALSDAFSKNLYDLAVVASPPGLHCEHACFVLDQGCNVLCEKPMATSAIEAAMMNAAAEKSGLLLGVAFSRRFYGNFADVADLVKQGKLGDELSFVYREGDTYLWPIVTGAAFRRDQSKGGALLDKGVHMLDQLAWIFGDAQLVDAYDDSLTDGVETNAMLDLAFPNASGRMQVSWEFSLNNELRIWGSRGEVSLSGADIRSYKTRVDAQWANVPVSTTWPADMAQKGGRRKAPSNPYESFYLQLIAMMRCIVYGEPFPVTGIGASRIQAILDSAYSIVEPMNPTWLSEDEQKAAQALHWKATQSR